MTNKMVFSTTPYWSLCLLTSGSFVNTYGVLWVVNKTAERMKSVSRVIHTLNKI